MMFGQLLCRFIHTTNIYLTSTVTKTSLASLRKRTGYSFANCKKALQLFDYDVDKAEEWLHSEAQKEGWAKVEKLKERATKQGLVAACKIENTAAMIEVNCETDFVARSSHFKSLVADVISACRQHAESKDVISDPIVKWNLSSSEVGLLPYQNGKTIADLVAMSVGKIGENINLRRALCMKVKDGLNFMVYAHPSIGEYDENAIHTGNYAATVIYQNTGASDVIQHVALTEFGRQLCQHIIGMNPKTVGSMDDLKEESESSDEEEIISEMSEDTRKIDDEKLTSSERDSGGDSSSSSSSSERDSGDDSSSSSSEEEEITETRLTHQKFVTDPKTTVGHLLREASIEVIDFTRFERGEDESQNNET